jgi:hypothetical protein
MAAETILQGKSGMQLAVVVTFVAGRPVDDITGFGTRSKIRVRLDILTFSSSLFFYMAHKLRMIKEYLWKISSRKGIRLDILTFSSSLKLSARSLAQLSQLK